MRYAALILSIISIAIPEFFIVFELLEDQLNEIIPDRPFRCGTPFYGLLVVLLIFSMVLSLIAAILSYFSARKMGKTGFSKIRRSIVFLMGPVWIFIFGFLINLLLPFIVT